MLLVIPDQGLNVRNFGILIVWEESSLGFYFFYMGGSTILADVEMA